MDGGGHFYEKEFPEVGELVVVKVLRLENNLGAYVSLLEYGGMEGLILPNELSKRRYRSIHKLIRVGRQEVVMVVRVDSEKGYVDLSKKRVAPEDIIATENHFSKSKKVYLTARQVATKLELSPEEVNRKAIWPLYRKYGHAYEGLCLAVENKEEAFANIPDCSQELIDALVVDVAARLTPALLKIRVRIHVSCSGRKGVVAVKEALLGAVETCNTSDSKKAELSIQLIASPLYSVICTTTDKQLGIKKVEDALKYIEDSMTAAPGGQYHTEGDLIICGADEQVGAEEVDVESSSEDSDDDDDDDDEEEEEEEEEEEGGEDEDDEDDSQEDRKKVDEHD